MVRRAVYVLLVLVLGSLMSAHAPAGPSKPPGGIKDGIKDDEYELQKMLVDTLDQVERNYVKGISRRELIEAAIEGVLKKLDPYSSYIGPDELEEFRNSVESEFGGIGIQISVDHGCLEVVSPLVGTPAYRAGILAGDRIVQIDGKGTAEITLDEAVRRLKGKEGTKVTLTVIHPGQTAKEEITVTRRRIRVETVLGDRRNEDDTWNYMLDAQRRIGYIRITGFSRNTAAELRNALDELKQRDFKALILDLRFNPGGLLSSAVEVSDMFIAKGRIVSTSSRNCPERKWDAHEKDSLEGVPMVVLVNRFTASAGEIVSACLQDHKRAVIMGERTWGKGSVQNVIELEHGRSRLKLTTAEYRRASGKNIHRFSDAKDEDEWGVMPDGKFLLKLDTAEMLALLSFRRDCDIVQSKPTGPPIDKPPAKNAKPDGDRPQTEKYTAKPKETVFVDRLLKMAVDYLKEKLMIDDR